MQKFNKLLVGGTFDQFHVGHQYFLWTAKSFCESLTVIVARDTTVQVLKKKLQRMMSLEDYPEFQKKIFPIALSS